MTDGLRGHPYDLIHKLQDSLDFMRNQHDELSAFTNTLRGKLKECKRIIETVTTDLETIIESMIGRTIRFNSDSAELVKLFEIIESLREGVSAESGDSAIEEKDIPDTCSPEMVAFIEWLVMNHKLFDGWEFIKYPLEKPYNFYDQYQEFKKERREGVQE